MSIKPYDCPSEDWEEYLLEEADKDYRRPLEEAIADRIIRQRFPEKEVA